MLKVTKADLQISGSIKAAVNLHLHADGSYNDQYKKNLFKFVPPGAGFQVGNLLVVGVSVSLDAVAKFNISAEADIYAGASMAINNFNAQLNMVDYKKSTFDNFTVSRL